MICPITQDPSRESESTLNRFLWRNVAVYQCSNRIGAQTNSERPPNRERALVVGRAEKIKEVLTSYWVRAVLSDIGEEKDGFLELSDRLR